VKWREVIVQVDYMIRHSTTPVRYDDD